MNPFNPTFGDVPKIFLDRSKQLNTVIKGLEEPVSPYQTTFVYSLRGSGKTTFLSYISNQMSKKDNWVVINQIGILKHGDCFKLFVIREYYFQCK